MAYSDVSICNLALAELGDTLITSLADDSDRARACNLFYGPTRDAVLRAHPWKFATTRKALAVLSTTPVDAGDGFLYQYALPTDCAKIQATSLDSTREPWKVEANPTSSGRVILCDSSSLTIKYTQYVTDPSQFDPLFVDALVARLASRLSIPIKSDQGLAQKFYQMYMAKIAEARTFDGMEGTSEVFEVTDLTDVRTSGSTGDRRSGWI